MPHLDVDGRIKFGQTVALPGPTACVCVEAFGGCIVALQVAVYDRQDQLLDGVGFDGHGEVLTTEVDGTASWLFRPPPGAHYIKWGMLPMRSVSNSSRYSISGKVRGHGGETLTVGRFDGRIPPGAADDGVVYDGVFVAQPPAVPPGSSA